MVRFVAVGLAAGALGLAGCIDNDSAALFIAGNVSPEESETTCSYSPENDLIARGAFNVDYRPAYRLFPLYVNQIVERSGEAPLRADPNGLHIRGAIVEIQQANGDRIDFEALKEAAGIDDPTPLPNPFRVAVADYVQPAEGIGGTSEAVGSVEAIPYQYADVLRLAGPTELFLIMLSVSVYGETNGGTEVKSAEWFWPIDVGRETYLIRCPGEEEHLGCNPGQDMYSDLSSFMLLDGRVCTCDGGCEETS